MAPARPSSTACSTSTRDTAASPEGRETSCLCLEWSSPGGADMKKILVAVGFLAVASVARAQDGLVVGLGNFFSPIVGDLDKAIAFYRDGIGLDIQGAPSNAEQNPALRNMFGLPDAQLRWMVGRPPAMRTGVEIVEVKKAEARLAERRLQDPGAFTLVLIVRELNPIITRLKAMGAP